MKLPAELALCFKLRQRVNDRLDRANARFKVLAESRTGDQRMREQLMDVLQCWFVLGRETPKPGAPPEAAADVTESNTEA